MIASFVNDGSIAIYQVEDPADLSKSDGKGPIKVLKKVHEREGFGIAWNPSTKGQLGTATNKQIGIWDPEASLEPTYLGDEKHEKDINDLRFNCKNPHLLVTVGEDCKCNFWDLRDMKKPTISQTCAENELNAVCCSPFSEHLLATSGDPSGIV
jgi:WD40 repeat protein